MSGLSWSPYDIYGCKGWYIRVYILVIAKAFFVDRLNGGLGFKRPSHVCRADLMKMLNHEEENIRFIARESLKLDMKSRGVSVTDTERNFLGYSLDQNHRLATTKTYGGSSDLPDLLFHVLKL